VIDASKAIVLLASDMGAISNVASASDFGTSITESTAKINDSICKVARHAEDISQFAMDTPAKSSDISALADKLASVIKEIKPLAQMLVSRKALNPLIPDTLISLANKAVNDADEASALTAIALQATIAAEASRLRIVT
jgi:hypothetical protein